MRSYAPVLALLLAAPSFAKDKPQDKGKRRERPPAADVAARHFDRMSRELELTEEQKEKIKPILEKSAAELETLHERARKVERESSEAIRALLTDEQKERFDVMRVRRKMRGHGARKGFGERRGRRSEDEGPEGGPEHEESERDERPDGPAEGR